MTLENAWTGPVIRFLSENLPGNSEAGWEHHFTTAYQIGCEALAALGQADETSRGAVPRDSPTLPEILPRWDDVSVAVLYLAAQNGLIGYVDSDDGVGSETEQRDKRNQELRHTPIAAAHGLGMARATPDALATLQALGLVNGGCWTKAAETVLWRDNPVEWSIDFTNDARFIDAVVQASECMPDNVRAETDQLVRITDEDVAAWETHCTVYSEELSARFGAQLVKMRPKTPVEVRAALEGLRRYDLDWLFFRRWRLGDGWLSPAETRRSLEIFHDPLAIAMRKAVIGRLYAHIPALAK